MKCMCFSDALPCPVPLNKFVSIFTSRPINAKSILKTAVRAGREGRGGTVVLYIQYTMDTQRRHTSTVHTEYK